MAAATRNAPRITSCVNGQLNRLLNPKKIKQLVWRANYARGNQKLNFTWTFA